MTYSSPRLYWRYVDVSFRSQMQYRMSFLIGFAGYFLVTGVDFLGLAALFARFGQIKGWTLPEVALFYGIMALAFSIAETMARGFDYFTLLIKTGDFDRFLVRPRSPAFQVLAPQFQLMRLGRFAQGALVLLWATQRLNVDWSLANVTLLFMAIAGGACLFAGLFILKATLCFWTTESLEVLNCFTDGGNRTGQYPLTIYRPWFRAIFTFVIPLATINYFPAHAILNIEDPLGSSRALQWLSPIAGIIFLGVCMQCWRFGVKHYTSTGN